VAEEQWRTRRSAVDTSLRTSAVWTAVRDLAEQQQAALGRTLRVLDLGGGTGGLAVPLAELGHDVVVVDTSPDALASLSRRSGERGVADRVHAVQGDAESLASLTGVVGEEPFDLVCCHGTLEVVDDPRSTLAALAAVLAPGGHLSLVSAQRLAVVLARALAGQFAQAHEALTSVDGRWGAHDPLPRRFDADQLAAMVEQSGLTVDQVHGVRLFSDLVPSAFVDSEADRAALLQLEQAAASHPQFGFLGQLGTTVHVLAHRAHQAPR
jgi:SAM-dependent methyltransferase